MSRILVKDTGNTLLVPKSYKYNSHFNKFLGKGISENIEGYYDFPISLLPLVRNIFKSLGISPDETELNFFYPNYEFDFSNPNFGTGKLRDEQYEVIKNNVQNNYRGILQCNTGFGKSELMIYLFTKYTGRGNKLLLTNNNQVAEELRLRFNKYGLDPKEMGVMILNPISFMNSNACKDEDILSFLADVDFIQIDELESVTNSLEELLKLVNNIHYLYGYSASPDKTRGRDLSDPHVLNEVSPDTVKVINLAGFSLYYKAPIKPIEVTVIKSRLCAEWLPEWCKKSSSPGALVTKQKLSQSNLFKNKLILHIIEDCILPNRKDILFIPYRFIEHGDKIYDYFKSSKYKILQWDGDKIRSNFQSKITQKEIKRLTEENAFDILIASKVADRGVDFRNLKDILLFLHTQYNNVIQVIGRISRESLDATAYVWLIEDENHKSSSFYSIMHKARMKRIKDAFKTSFSYGKYLHEERKYIPPDKLEVREPDNQVGGFYCE